MNESIVGDNALTSRVDREPERLKVLDPGRYATIAKRFSFDRAQPTGAEVQQNFGQHLKLAVTMRID